MNTLDNYINPGPCEGFDSFAGKRWIYPNNMTIRGYQKNAVEKCLFANSMIVLPTGFGKTFIAAVVMYNFHRWYPQGKIIFVAPTKPLVNQQIDECKKISGIPSSECIQLTGCTTRDKRETEWEKRRVFFATPQVIENDLNTGLLPAKKVRCIIIDEAHRAQGNFAYVGIVRNLHKANRNGFRIVALSATPGTDIERVKQVLLNLYVKEVLFRSENSIDLMAFKNERISKAWTLELTGKHKMIVDKYIQVADPIIKELYKAGLTYSSDSITKVAKFTLFKAQEKITNNEGNNIGSRKGKLRFYCAAAISLAHNFELLTVYGLRPFYASVKNNLSGPRSTIRTVTAGNVNFDILMNEIENMFGQDSIPDHNKRSDADLLQGHPKLKVVKELLFKHFETKTGTETRAIVFTKYKESVFDIVQTMKSFEPIIKAAPFVGQGNSTKKQALDVNNNKAMTQKEQIQTIKDFKEGKFNVLVATCVAEEGLDIGEVDLIICYDTSSSPISNTQRRGRTGRKRSGDIQTLLTKGFEEKKLSKAGKCKREVEDKLFNKDNYFHTRYRDSPRMVPLNINPVCLEQKIFPINDEPEIEKKPKRERKKRKREVVEEEIDKKKFAKNPDKECQMDSDSDLESFVKSSMSYIQSGSTNESQKAYEPENEFESSADHEVGSNQQDKKDNQPASDQESNANHERANDNQSNEQSDPRDNDNHSNGDNELEKKDGSQNDQDKTMVSIENYNFSDDSEFSEQY